jgi:hypothetical protein
VLFDYLLNVDARSFVACHFNVPEVLGTLRLLEPRVRVSCIISTFFCTFIAVDSRMFISHELYCWKDIYMTIKIIYNRILAISRVKRLDQ